MHGRLGLFSGQIKAMSMTMPKSPHLDKLLAWVTQIMNLPLLALDIEETLMSLKRIEAIRAPACLRSIQAIALKSDWRNQRRAWERAPGD